MGDWPAAAGGARAASFGVTSLTNGTTVASSATADTYGSWVELEDSTPFDADGVRLQLMNGTASKKFAVDLGVGASGFEQVIASKLRHTGTVYTGFAAEWDLPLRIPAGSRLAARCMSDAAAADSLQITGLLLSHQEAAYQRVERCDGGGSSEGVAVGNTVDHVKGSWVQLTTPTVTSFDYRQMLVACQPWNASPTVSYRVLVDIGVGVSGSQVVVLPDLMFNIERQSDTIIPPVIGPLPVSIPAGSEMWARGQPEEGFYEDARQVKLTAYGIG